MTGALRRVVGTVAVVVVTGVVAYGFAQLGPPSEERHRRLDHRRVEDLKRIAHAVDRFVSRRERLPASIDEVVGDSQLKSGVASRLHAQNVRDPLTAQPYAYRVLTDETYEMCATFDRASPDGWFQRRHGAFWSHLQGAQCFLLP